MNGPKRFGLRLLFLLTGLVGIGCALVQLACGIYYQERRAAKTALADVRGISFTIVTYEEVFEEVARINIELKENPGARIVLGSLEDYQTSQEFSVSQLGRWRFVITGRRHTGAIDAETGEPVESICLSNHITLGANSPFNGLIPFRVHTLQDLVDRYAELDALFVTWPRKSQPGTVTFPDGSTQQFYVVP